MSFRCLAVRWACLGWLLSAAAGAEVRAGVPTIDSLAGLWDLRDDVDTRIAAQVPGVVQLDLLRAGKIADPMFRDNAKTLDWIDRRTWTYSRTFTLSPQVALRQRHVLRCEGLDTIARIQLNGVDLGHTDNMFRTYEFDVTRTLRVGENRLEITFSPLEPYIEAFIRDAKGPNAAWTGWANVRKAAFHNGWDFCARVRSVGIEKAVSIVGFDQARLRRTRVESVANVDGSGVVRVSPEVDGAAGSVRVRVSHDGKTVASVRRAFGDGRADPIELVLPNVDRWWPRGMGGQPLYDVEVELLDDSASVLDVAERRVGFRRVDVRPGDADRPMQISINGRPLFARGAAWVPPDLFVSRVGAERYRRLLEAAADANMNMVRTWGGGTYEPDAFFDACDELGLLVWFDFKFACNVFPGGNPRFADNVRAEITDQLSRVGHHASIGLYCGNNEAMGAVTSFKVLSLDDYNHFYHGVIGARVSELLPDAAYIGGSPEAGDEHNWWVWHLGADFEHYRSSHGLMSEFGFQSFPHPQTIASASAASDRTALLSEGLRTLQHNGTQKGNEHIVEMMQRYFRVAGDYERDVWLSQINQAMGLQIGIDHWRGDWPRSTGELIWQFNDANPGPSWSIIDYFGRKKAAWYAARRSFAPIALSALSSGNQCDIRVCADLTVGVDGTVSWRLTDTDGTTHADGSTPVHLPAGTSAVAVPPINLDVSLEPTARLLWLQFDAGGETQARKTVLFVRPKVLALPDPAIRGSVEPDGDDFIVTLNADRPALWVWLDLNDDPDAAFDDNFFDLAPGEPVRIRVTPSKPFTASTFRQALSVRSLYDTLPDAPTSATRPAPAVASPSARP